jgi:uncharacterized protein (DUF433 family)
MILSNEHIVSDPDMCFGKPRIAGSRFSVKDVVAHHYYQGLLPEVIASKWRLPLAGVYAALAYYQDHKAEIDQSFEDDEAFVMEMKAKNGSLLDGLNRMA